MNEKPILFSGAMVRAILAKAETLKTQTRRVFNPQPSDVFMPQVGRYHRTMIDRRSGEQFPSEQQYFGASDENEDYECKYGQPGDRLWVKETFAICTQVDGNGFPDDRPYLDFAPLKNNPKFGKIAADYIIWRADGETEFADEDGGLLVRKDGSQGSLWKPSIFMCREYSRITLEIVSVRVERLQEISAADAMAEGIEIVGQMEKPLWKNYRFDEQNPMYRAYQSPVRSYQSLWESINGPGSWELNPWVWVIQFKRIQP